MLTDATVLLPFIERFLLKKAIVTTIFKRKKHHYYHLSAKIRKDVLNSANVNNVAFLLNNNFRLGL